MLRRFRLPHVAALATTLLVGSAGVAHAAPDTLTFAEVSDASISSYTDCNQETTSNRTDGFVVVTRDQAEGELTFEYEVDGDAEAGVDYEPLTGEGVFADGESSVQIPFSLLETYDGGWLELTLLASDDVILGETTMVEIQVTAVSGINECDDLTIAQVTEGERTELTTCAADGNLGPNSVSSTAGSVTITRSDPFGFGIIDYTVQLEGSTQPADTQQASFDVDALAVTIEMPEPTSFGTAYVFTIVPNPASYSIVGAASATVTTLGLIGDVGFCPGPPIFAEAATSATIAAGKAMPPLDWSSGHDFDHVTADITFRVSEGALPPGIALASDGTFSGTATTTGTYEFTVQGCHLLDGDEACNATVLSVTVSAALPDTGADTTTLLLAGLLALALGGALVRRAGNLA